MFNLAISATEYKDGIERIKRERKKGLVLFVLTVFGDESFDEKEQRVFAVAGVMGTQEEWDDLEVLWRKRTNGIPFHATDCRAGRGDYKNNSREENKKLYRDLVGILINTKMIGCAYIDSIEIHKKYFPHIKRTAPYHLCFQKVVREFTKIAHLSIPRQQVEFIFDINSRTQGSCVVLYDCLRNSKQWELSERLSPKISFDDHRNSIGIQVADLLAGEAMRHADNHLLGPRGGRPSDAMHRLISCGRFNFKLLAFEYFEECKAKLEEQFDIEGFIDAYDEWRKKKRVQDNLRNRYSFLLETGRN